MESFWKCAMSDLEIFKKYVSKYDLNNPNIKEKYWHSVRVSNNALEIADAINLNDKDKRLASFIGLTHDIGRFLQWDIYETFKDTENVDHASLSVQVLFGSIANTGFVINDADVKIIRTAISNHNKYKIQDNITERELLFAKIIRDADKLDLLYLLGSDDTLVDEDNSEVTNVVHDAFFKGKGINAKYCNTLTDKILLKMAFIFDLNFLKSFNIIKENKLLDKFYNNLKYKDRYKKYYLYTKKFLETKKISD